ncbi:MAG: GDSL-type esterase/lipase family protein [Acidimicrobiales bacterium]
MGWRRAGVAVLGAGALLGAVMVSQWSGGCAEAQAAAGPIRIMPLGDSITAGGGPEHSYRGPLQQHLNAAGVSFDLVGSYGNIVPAGGEATWAWAEDSQTNYNGPLDKDFEGHGGFQAGQPVSVVGYQDHMLAQMVPTDIPLFQPDVVLLHIGTNDYLGGWTTHGPWHGPAGPEDQRAAYSARNVIDLIDAIHSVRPQAWIVVSPVGRAGLNGVLNGLSELSALVSVAVAERAAAGRNIRFVGTMYDNLTLADLADAVHPNESGNAKMALSWYNALMPVLGQLGVPGAPPVPSPPAPITVTAAPTPAAPSPGSADATAPTQDQPAPPKEAGGATLGSAPNSTGDAAPDATTTAGDDGAGPNPPGGPTRPLKEVEPLDLADLEHLDALDARGAAHGATLSGERTASARRPLTAPAAAAPGTGQRRDACRS